MFNISFSFFRSKTYKMDMLIKKLSECNLNLDYIIKNSNKISEHSMLTFVDIDSSKLKTKEYEQCSANYKIKDIINYKYGGLTICIVNDSFLDINNKLKNDEFFKYKNKIVSNYDILSKNDKLQFECDYKETIITLLNLITAIGYADLNGEYRLIATEIVKLINDSLETVESFELLDIVDDLKFELEYLRKINGK